VFIFKDQGVWKLVSIMNDGIQVIEANRLSEYLEDNNGCILNGYKGGKLELAYSKKGMFLDISYQFGD
jgi:hypothetical protein